MTPQPILSIDPGASGGIAWTSPEGVHYALKMPPTQGEVLDTLRHFARLCVVSHLEPLCCLEQVGGFIRPGHGGQNSAAAHTMFTFGEGFGFLKGCIMALGMKLVMVHPKKWQKHFSLGAKKDCAAPKDWKNKLKAEAQRRYPGLAVTLPIADALLIMEWARHEFNRDATLPRHLQTHGCENEWVK